MLGLKIARQYSCDGIAGLYPDGNLDIVDA